jgi:hypothetical protein
MTMNARWRGTGRGAAGRGERGAAAVEFALVGGLYLLSLMMVVELGVLFSVNLTMQYAVREGARYAVVGLSDADPNQANPARYRAVVQKMADSSMGLWDKVSPVITVSTNGGAPHQYATPGDYTASMFGSPGDIVALQLDCSWPLATPLAGAFFTGGVYRFSVGATMRNEAFE